MRREPWSVGVIGAGQVVRNTHLPVLTTSLPTRVAWLLDIDASRAAALADAYGVPACRREDLSSRLATVDIVLLAAPFGARTAYYEELARLRSIGLFVEKPIAKTVEQHLAICSIYPDFQVACGLSRRVADPVRAALDVIGHRLFGGLRAVRAAFGRRGSILGGGQYHSDPALAGGGVLLEMGVHYLDAALYCAAATDVHVESGLMIEDAGFDLHTDARLQIALGDGTRVPFDVKVSVLADQREGIEFECEHATLSLSLSRNRLTVRSRDGGYCADLTPAVAPRTVTSFRLIHAFWQDFLDGLDERRPGVASARSSLLTTKAIEGLYLLPRPG